MGTTIYFADESGIRSDYHTGTTWAPCGNPGRQRHGNPLHAARGPGAFDFNVFEYGVLTSRAENEANVKKLNQGVLKTNPPDAVKSLVSGLYGGRNLPLATQNSAYRPSDWDTEPALWNVVVTDCQGCHTLSEQDVRNLNYWKGNVGSFREEVLNEKLMPNSPYANRRFWNTNNHQIVEDALKRFRP